MKKRGLSGMATVFIVIALIVLTTMGIIIWAVVKGSVSPSSDSTNVQQKLVNKLLAREGVENGSFGYSVSISGDYAIVGSPSDYNKGTNIGSAYIFKKNSSGQFEEVNKLLASDRAFGDHFGVSVSISGDYAIVGAYQHTERLISNCGAAYIYKKNPTTGQFEEVNKLLASDRTKNDYFGYSVSISGDYAIVGAYYEEFKGNSTGSAYIFKKNSTGQFEEVNKITASDGAVKDFFGYSVSISGDYAIVGANMDDDKGLFSGSAYIFKKNSTGQFEQVNKLLASDGTTSDFFGVSLSNDFFGESVSISGDYAIVGAPGEDNKGLSRGSAYIFKKNSTGQFEEVNKITASDRTIDDHFGVSVSISGDYAIVGAPGKKDKKNSTGSAYFYSLP